MTPDKDKGEIKGDICGEFVDSLISMRHICSRLVRDACLAERQRKRGMGNHNKDKE